VRGLSLMHSVDRSRIGCRVLCLCALLVVLGLPGTGLTQTYPSRPIRLVVPYPPGGGLDLFARTVAPKLGQQLGQPVVIENRPGASGVIGADVAAKSAPDGYTILIAFGSQYLQPFVSKNVPYDTRADFTPIVGIARAPNVVVVHPSVPAASITELVSYARARPGQIAYVTAGAGTSQHLAGLLMEMSGGIKMLHVSYKGGGPALNDLIGGQVQMGILVMSTVWAQVKAGKIRVVAVVESTRSKYAPEVPTIGEAAIPGYAMPDLWLGFLAPRGLPPAIVNRLNEEITVAAYSPDITPKLEVMGYELTRSTPAQFSEQIDRSLEAYGRITSAAGIKPE
jgi:tripartite-type tricarboxylate transporter receptor subunit TctC